jgi:acetyltransferase EpsM
LNDLLKPGAQISGTSVLGPFESWREQPERASFLAPLHKAKEMQRRAMRIRSLEVPDARWDRVIDPAAFVATDATVDRGSVITPFAVVDTQARVGRFVLLWPGAQVGHNSVIGDFVFLGRAAIVSGFCEVAEGAHIGPGAVVRERNRIGRYAVVGAGAVVLNDVPDHAIVAGNPARPIGRLDPRDDPA